MLHITDTLRMRQHQKISRHPSLVRRTLIATALVLSILIALGSIGIGGLFFIATRDLPSPELLSVLLNPQTGQLLQPTKFFDRTGKNLIFTLENPAAGPRKFLSTDNSQDNFLPSSLISATLATADPQFWQHPGFQIGGLDPVVHSTLAQKLSSNLLLWQEPPSLLRAVRERLLAAQITKRYGRATILGWYLNIANYGRLALGAEAAAQVYFGKAASDLSLGEATILAAAIQSPALNPLDAPKASLQRGLEILQEMHRLGWISNSQAHAAQQEEIEFRPTVPAWDNIAPAFINLSLTQASFYINRSRLELGGFQVFTTLDFDLQSQASCAASIHLDRLQTGNAIDEQLSDCPAARLLPTLPTGGDLKDLAASVVIIEPGSGQLLAMVGQVSPGLDPASMPGRPPGTLLTPFIYLTGLSRGMNPASLVWDIPKAGSEEADILAYRGPSRLRVALVNDYLSAVEYVLDQVGAESAWSTAYSLGFDDSELQLGNDLGDILDESETTLLEATRAFGVFANQGVLAGQFHSSSSTDFNLAPQAVTVLSITDSNAVTWYQAGPSALQSVISPQLAYLMNHTLSDEAARWPSLGHPNPLEIGRPAAAKLGSTTSRQDAWAVGYTPSLSAGVWIGKAAHDTSATIHPRQAASLWHALIQYAHREIPIKEWTIPNGIATMVVCDPSGLLPTPECPSVVNEVFLQGSEPIQFDNLYQSININRETGQLATIFTPPELVETRVYMIFPVAAKEWARSAGIKSPPDNFDMITAVTHVSRFAQITKPEMYSYVRDHVRLSGSAGGDGFERFYLQAGKGMNPQEWIKIGDDILNPVDAGALGTWDTAGLSGLYTVQLVVLRQNQLFETATIQVTIDNQPPIARILYPSPGEIIQGFAHITFQVEASDDLGIGRIQLFVDGQEISRLEQSPYVASWQSIRGQHTLEIIATDLAGNTDESKVEFEVR